MTATTLITVPAVGSANLIEILWTLIGLAGLGVVLPNLWAAINGMDVLGRTPADERAAAAVLIKGNIRRELLRVLKLLLIVLIGIVAMAQTQPPGTNKTTITGLILTGVLFSVGVIISLQSILDKRDSRKARAILAERVQARSGV